MITGWYLDRALQAYFASQLPDRTEAIEDIQYHFCSCYYGLRQLSPTGHYLRLAEEAYTGFISDYPTSARAPRAVMMLAAFWTERAWDGITTRENAVNQLERTLAMLRTDSPPLVRSRLHLMAGELFAQMGENRKALGHLQRAIDEAERDENPLTKRRTLIFAHYYALQVCRDLADKESAVRHGTYLVEHPPKSQEELFNANLEEFLEYIEKVAKGIVSAAR